jgi:hypothetical protein
MPTPLARSRGVTRSLTCAMRVGYTAAVPRLLSETGIYADIASKTTDTSLKYFEINAPLWSDGSAKKRWIILPPGRQLEYVDTTDMFDYPDSTVFVKTFLLDSIAGDSSTRVYWETRLLVQGGQTWHGFSYKWNKEQTEAHLVSLEEGFDTLFYWRPQGPGGELSYKKWRFPSQRNCATCHVQGGREALSFLPAQLKRPSSVHLPGNPGTNQIDMGTLRSTGEVVLLPAGVDVGVPGVVEDTEQ